MSISVMMFIFPFHPLLNPVGNFYRCYVCRQMESCRMSPRIDQSSCESQSDELSKLSFSSYPIAANTNQNGTNAVILATTWGKTESLLKMIESGADISSVDQVLSQPFLF